MFMRVNAKCAHQVRPPLKAVDPERLAESAPLAPRARKLRPNRV
jgi:hypothetical protein